MSRVEATALLAALLMLSAYAVQAAVPFPAETAVVETAGKRIYLDGVLPSGEPLRGMVRNGVALSGAAAACAACHRRSGLGGGEGQRTVRPIAGRLLFDARQGRAGQRIVTQEGRPVYTQATLARALREGVDPAGRRLDALMPRYELGDDEVWQLASYLDQLAPANTPGVTGSEIHFATVIAPDVRPEQQQAMLAVLQAFVGDKNGGTRQEARRREVGRSVIGSEQMYRGYRNWRLHAWRLEGKPATWAEQLERHYRRQPVFAMLGGRGAGDWQPVHEFCERNEIPCLFPDVDIPVTEGRAYSSFYFSRGLALEAEVLARHLIDSGRSGAVMQVYRDDAGGRAAAQALRSALHHVDVIDRPLAGSRPVTDAFWNRVLDTDRPQTLILWLDDADLAGFPVRREAPPWLGSLYLSGSLARSTDRFASSGEWMEKARIVYRYELPERLAPRMARMKFWLKARNVPVADERIQAHAYFAATIAGEALAHMDDNFSRDYFIERVEHMTEQSLFPSVYPRLSLGPGQRYASRGGYVAGYAGEGGRMQSSGWIVP